MTNNQWPADLLAHVARAIHSAPAWNVLVAMEDGHCEPCAILARAALDALETAPGVTCEYKPSGNVYGGGDSFADGRKSPVFSRVCLQWREVH